MKAKQCCVVSAIGLLFLAVLISLGYIVFRVLSQRQDQTKLEYLPPEIQITSPQDGVSVPAGSYLSAMSIITFPQENPVKTVEWWLDGNLLESHALQPAADATKAEDPYSLLIPSEGTHLLVARAINTQGVIGTSLPLTIQSSAKGDAYFDIPLQEGETLGSLAADRETDEATLQELNLDLNESPAAGTLIKVPAAKENEKPSPLPGLPQPVGITMELTSPMLQTANPLPAGVFDLFAAAPPNAPTKLQGEVKDCKVKLAWEDNASDETGYDIWMAAPGAALKRMVGLNPVSGGTAWFEFQAPGPGYYLFWVDAVNSIGKSGSNIIYLNIDTGCPAGTPTHLQVDVQSITVSSGADRVYCYISFDGAPEERLPLQNGQFIQVADGKGDLASWPHSFALAMPKNKSIHISGECWGWAGQDLSKLGSFSTSISGENWDGKPLTLKGGTVEISLSIRPEGMDSSRTIYADNGGLPEPYNIKIKFHPQPDIAGCTTSCWVLSWDFKSPPSEYGQWTFNVKYLISDTSSNLPGFWLSLKAGLKGDVRHLVLAEGGYDAIMKTLGCGAPITFIVEARNLTQYINTEGILATKLLQCPAYITVSFDYIYLPWTGDGFNGGPCDELESYFTIMVDEWAKDYWGGCSFGTGCLLMPLKCDSYWFKDIVPQNIPEATTFTVPYFADEIKLALGSRFYDYDDYGSDDPFAQHTLYHTWKTRAEAEAELGCSGKHYESEKLVNDTADSILHYTISISPNPCTKK